MYSATFMRILVGRDIDEHTPEKKQEESPKTPIEKAVYGNSGYATIPIEVKK